MSASTPPRQTSLPRPRKRPVQDRSRFTVQAIYDAYVRIWRRGGADAVTMRALADESGFAIGTIYEYFPNKPALHSGYIRHVMDSLRERIREQVVEQGEGSWRTRLALLVSITCGGDPDAAYFDRAMHDLESGIASQDDHQRSFDALANVWWDAVCSWADLTPPPAPERVRMLVFMVWSAVRYRILVAPLQQSPEHWRDEILEICECTLSGHTPE
ncbi:TetR/AcrR family transcriptional regulator [Maricaulis alexandrii]|uniref:TetR/AcrR family transcriptional regulator n=1 Tax=Maricaulis alexandrii TaxID=2570354 RepID=UPI001108E246|nr:TetR/AcrR family transcriptional regulator [Maricaulis alexandrii]